jgi:foldase protein PrsA
VQCDDDAAWANYLAQRGYTPETLRKTTVYELASPIIVKDKADELGLSVDEKAVDAQMSAMRGSLLAQDDETWASELERFGTNEEQMRERYENRNLKEQVIGEVAKDVVPTEDDTRMYVEDNLVGYTAKKLACVYGSDYQAVQKLFDTAKAAKTASEGFAKAKRSVDEKVTHYEDLGWDLTCELTSGMVKEVSELKKGQMPDSLFSEDGTHYLFYVVDEHEFEKEDAKSGISDSSLSESVLELATADLKKTAGDAWLQQQIESSLVVNAMPQGLSYDVDMSLADAESSTTQSAGSAAEDAK